MQPTSSGVFQEQSHTNKVMQLVCTVVLLIATADILEAIVHTTHELSYAPN